MNISDYVAQDSTGLAALIKQGEVSPGEVCGAAVAACEKVNPKLNAVIDSWPEEISDAIAEAVKNSQFFGVPFLIKDMVINMRGKRCELGSRLAKGLEAPTDSHLMQRFCKAGLVTFGRTSCPEFGVSPTCEAMLYGPTRNPWNTDKSTGGSSGGAAAAVAAGIVPTAHANDGGGSIRIPSAWCGTLGMKPSRGRVSFGPNYDEPLFGMGTELVITRTVRDLASMLQLSQGPERGDPWKIEAPLRSYVEEPTRRPGELRIGVFSQAFGGKKTDSRIVKQLEKVMAVCLELGHRVEIADVSLGVSWDEYSHGCRNLWTSFMNKASTTLASITGRSLNFSSLEPMSFAACELGRKVTALDIYNSLEMKNKCARTVGGWYEKYDLILSPTMPTFPVNIGHFDADNFDGVEDYLDELFSYISFTQIANTTGLPAISMPICHDEEQNLPVGMQFMADFGREDVLLQMAAQLEASMPWIGRRPGIWAGNN